MKLIFSKYTWCLNKVCEFAKMCLRGSTGQRP